MFMQSPTNAIHVNGSVLAALTKPQPMKYVAPGFDQGSQRALAVLIRSRWTCG
jgi:hypothetical protein